MVSAFLCLVVFTTTLFNSEIVSGGFYNRGVRIDNTERNQREREREREGGGGGRWREGDDV